MVTRRHGWTILTASLLVVYGAVALSLPHGHLLAAFGDLTQLLLVVLATALMVANAVSTQGQTRVFWLLWRRDACCGQPT